MGPTPPCTLYRKATPFKGMACEDTLHVKAAIVSWSPYTPRQRAERNLIHLSHDMGNPLPDVFYRVTPYQMYSIGLLEEYL